MTHARYWRVPPTPIYPFRDRCYAANIAAFDGPAMSRPLIRRPNRARPISKPAIAHYRATLIDRDADGVWRYCDSLWLEYRDCPRDLSALTSASLPNAIVTQQRYAIDKETLNAGAILVRALYPFVGFVQHRRFATCPHRARVRPPPELTTVDAISAWIDERSYEYFETGTMRVASWLRPQSLYSTANMRLAPRQPVSRGCRTFTAQRYASAELLGVCTDWEQCRKDILSDADFLRCTAAADAGTLTVGAPGHRIRPKTKAEPVERMIDALTAEIIYRAVDTALAGLHDESLNQAENWMGRKVSERAAQLLRQFLHNRLRQTYSEADPPPGQVEVDHIESDADQGQQVIRDEMAVLQSDYPELYEQMLASQDGQLSFDEAKSLYQKIHPIAPHLAREWYAWVSKPHE